MWQIVAGVALGVVAGVALAVVLDRFWDSIVSWLNNTAADAVGRILGYEAKKRMQKAVVTIDRFRDKVRNKGVIYTKKNAMDGYFTKVTYETEAMAYLIEDDVLKEIDEKGQLINQFEYHN